MLWWTSRRSISAGTIFRGWVYVTSRAPHHGCSLIQTNIAEVLHPSIIPYYWGKTRVEYITKICLRLSGEAALMVILIIDGVGKVDLGMVTTFCSHNQVKMEALEVLTTLHQHDSPEPSVFMVRRYTNTPFIPQGTSRLLYIDVSDLFRGTSSTQFPLNCLHLWKLPPYSKTEVLLPHEGGRQGTEHTPLSREVLWKCSKESCHLSNPVSLSMPSPAPPSHLEKRHSYGEEIRL